MCLFFLALRCMRGSFSVSGILQDLAAGFLCSFFPSPFVFLALLDSCLVRNTAIRLSLQHALHFRSLRSFGSSAAALSVWPEGLLFLAWLGINPLILSFIDWFGLIGCLFPLFPFTPTDANVLVWLCYDTAQLLRPKPKTAFTSPITGETFERLDPRYPLLRRTLRFNGSKTFQLRIKQRERPHVLFVFLESFRAKDIGALGANPSHSPHFDALAKEGILFSQFHSNGIFTFDSWSAALYGIPSPLSPLMHNFCVDIPMIGIPHFFAKRGYETCLIQGGHLLFWRAADFFRSHGFDRIFGPGDIKSASGTSWGAADKDTFRFAANWLKSQTNPAFLTLFSITNHHPWRMPGSSKRDFRETFAYTDEALGAFVTDLDAKDLLEKTILFILADHGQGQGERTGSIIGNKHIYQEITHIPLLIYAKNRIDKSQVISELASHIDLPPTLLDLFHMQEPHHSMGRSLLRTGSSEIPFVHGFSDPVIGKRSGRLKTIVHILSKQVEVYDLETDPGETRNLWDGTEYPDIARFHFSIETMYRNRQFAPSGLESLKKPESIDSSGSFSLTLSRRSDLTDQMVIDAIGSRPSLLSLDLSYCPFLTDKAVQQIFLSYPQLEELTLRGNELMTGAWEASGTKHLVLVNLLKCPNLESKKVAAWLSSQERLHDLRLNVSNFTKCDYQRLGSTKSMWIRLNIEQGHTLDDDALGFLLERQLELTDLVLDGAAIRKATALQGLPIRYLHFKNCSHVTEETLSALSELPLGDLEMVNCPGIQEQSLEPFKAKQVRVVLK